MPNTPQLEAQDPTWDVASYGGLGNLWFPHVYMPAQWPDNPDASRINCDVGRGRQGVGPRGAAMRPQEYQ